jgi:hypothetical protein
MKTALYLESFSALLPEGIITPAEGVRPWNDGQSGPADVTRDQVLDKPYLSFGKLSLPDRLAFSAASLVLSAYTIADADAESAGISIGLPGGSLSTDLRYMESVYAGFPSPAVFSATLPSSAIADIAIFFGLKGENRVIAGDAGSGLAALDCARTMLSAGKAKTVIVLSVNAVEPMDFSSPLLPDDFDRENRAFAFLLSTQRQPCGLGLRFDASLEQCNKDQPKARGELYFYELVKLLCDRTFVGGSVECGSPDIRGRITITKDE